MGSWTRDVAACLDMLFAPNELFDTARLLRAEPLLRRLHPRFVGSVHDKLREQLLALRDLGALDSIDGRDVWRWRGLPPELQETDRRARTLAKLQAKKAERVGEPAAPVQPAAAVAPAQVAPAPPPRAADRPPEPEDFQRELERRFAEAARGGKGHVHVSSFDLHRAVAPYPAPNHRMPHCCRVLRAAAREGDTVLVQSPTGKDGPELLIRYRIPR